MSTGGSYISSCGTGNATKATPPVVPPSERSKAATTTPQCGTSIHGLNQRGSGPRTNCPPESRTLPPGARSVSPVPHPSSVSMATANNNNNVAGTGRTQNVVNNRNRENASSVVPQKIALDPGPSHSNGVGIGIGSGGSRRRSQENGIESPGTAAGMMVDDMDLECDR